VISVQTSRAHILKHATEYIQFMNKKNGSIQKDIESMKRQNHHLRQQGTLLILVVVVVVVAAAAVVGGGGGGGAAAAMTAGIT